MFSHSPGSPSNSSHLSSLNIDSFSSKLDSVIATKKAENREITKDLKERETAEKIIQVLRRIDKESQEMQTKILGSPLYLRALVIRTLREKSIP